MDDLHFNNDHNKVAYLLKPKESQGFHKIIDFMNGLYIMYALTANPTINASLVGQFWGLASEVSLPDGVKGLVATIDGEPALVQAQPQEVSPPPPSPVVEPHPSTDPIPSPPRPSEPVLETITYPIRDDDTSGGSFPERPPSPSPATSTRSPTVGVAEEPLTLISLLSLFPTCLQRIANLEAELKATKILHRDVVELEALHDLANAALHEPSHSSTPSKPVYPDQSSEQEISPTSLDVILTLSQSKTRDIAAKIIYKRLKKQQSSSGLDFIDAAIPAVGRVSAGGANPANVVVFAGGADPADVVVSASGADSAGKFISAGISVTAGPSIPSAPSSPIRDPAKGKAIATPSSPRVAEEQEREIRASAAQSTLRQAELDRIALNLTNEEWIGLVDQWQKVIAKIKAKAKRDKPLTPAQQKEFMRAFLKNQTKDNHQHLKRSGDTLESSESKKLKSYHGTEQSAKLQDTTSVSAGDPISTVPFVSTVPSVSDASSILAKTPIAAGVSTTAGISKSAGEASVPIIDLLDSPPKATSLPLDPETAEHAVPLRKSSKKKSMARRRTLPRPF
nr:hypothetical protein [Tanacetum cinerariifolium]